MSTAGSSRRGAAAAIAGGLGVAVVAGAILLATAAGGSSGGYAVRAIFDDAANIVPSEDVKIDGVKVGTVGSVTPTPIGKAAVVLNIDNPGFQDFRADASCVIEPQALIGEKFVDCLPTQPRPEGTPLPPPLHQIPAGREGAGQWYLPVTNTSSPIDQDLLNDINHLPENQRLTIIINELGAGLAGRGSDLNAVLHRSNPALHELEKVFGILASENKVLGDLAVEGDRSLVPIARDRRQFAEFFAQANTVSTATARHRARARRKPARTSPSSCASSVPPQTARPASPTQATPTFTDLGVAAPGINRTFESLRPFSNSSTQFFQSLGKTSKVTGPALVATQPFLRQLETLGGAVKPFASNFAELLSSFRSTGGLERLLDFIFLGTNSANGYNSLGHFVRTVGVGKLCSVYKVHSQSGCEANFVNGSPAPPRRRAPRRARAARVPRGSALSRRSRTAPPWPRRSRSTPARKQRVPSGQAGRRPRPPWAPRPSPSLWGARAPAPPTTHPAAKPKPAGCCSTTCSATEPAMRPPRHDRSLRARLWPALAGVLALALLAASASVAQGEGSAGTGGAGGPSSTGETSETSTSTSSTSTAPGSEAPAGVHGQVGEPPSTTETPPAAQGGAGTSEATATTPAPEVEAQSPQAASTPGGVSGNPSHHGHAHRGSGGTGAGTPPSHSAKQPSTLPAPPPSALTPPLPGALGAPISGIPDFFIESFRIPPFLLPIYQAAGTAYDIPWQVLAAINEVETDYGRDLSVSSAGAEGWMQFLPSSWARYGVDANGDGYEDPYNPADAIFAAARYLQAAGGGTAAGGGGTAEGGQHIRAAIFAYNHSQQYVESVMLRAQLLEGTPPELLSAITGLTESRFPVHAPAHFADGFPAMPGDSSRTLAGTTIYSQAGAPVIAVQDGEVTAVGDSPTLGRYVSLRDAYGNTYTYAQLGSVAALYPVLEPRVETAVSRRIVPTGPGLNLPKPSAPASAGVQPHSPLSEGAVSSGLALGAASALETPPPAPVAPASPPSPPAPSASASTPRVFRAGPDEVYLRPLAPGVQVLAGTVLGHLGAAGEDETVPAPASAAGQSPLAETAEPHMLFQIRPAGAGAPLIDPKPILDGWVRLEETSIFRAKGENPFLATSPTVGQVLLASKPQLEQLLLRDPGVRLPRCERGEVRAGEVDRRVLAALEFLSVSGLSPTVSAAGCAHGRSAPGAGNAVGAAAGDAVDISAIDGTPLAGHEGPGSLTDVAVRRLLRLQGTAKPAQIVSAESYPGTDNTLTLPGYRGLIHVAFASPLAATASRTGARAAGVRLAGKLASPLTPSQWLQLVSQLGEIPEPVVTGKPSAAAIPDRSGG